MHGLGCTGLDHPALAAANPAAQAKWYVDVLDYRLFFHHEAKDIWIVAAPDGTMLEIMPRDDRPRPDRTTCTPGWSHLALRVLDMDRACACLEGRGVRFDGPAFAAVGGGTVRNFPDPEGNLVQIVQRFPPA